MAIMHMKGSHQINLTDEDVSEIVSWEASPETMYKPWPKLYPEVKEKPPQKKVKDKDAVKSWWDKVNGWRNAGSIQDSLSWMPKIRNETPYGAICWLGKKIVYDILRGLRIGRILWRIG
jgi:hypothetical protein